METHLLGAASGDRSIILYDTREVGPVRKVVMNLKTNVLAWNPMEAMVFTAASEDYNLYTFDVRKLDRPTNVLMDHVGAVVDVDYSPTGKVTILRFIRNFSGMTIKTLFMTRSWCPAAMTRRCGCGGWTAAAAGTCTTPSACRGWPPSSGASTTSSCCPPGG